MKDAKIDSTDDLTSEDEKYTVNVKEVGTSTRVRGPV